MGDGPSRETAAPPVTDREVLEVVRALARELHAGSVPARVGPTADLERDLGLGSLERLELLKRLEARAGHPLPDAAVFRARTVADLVRILEARVEPRPPAPGPVTLSSPEGVPPLPASARTLGEVLEHQARAAPSRPYLLLLDQDRLERELTFADLADLAARCAGGLYRRGVSPGDRVAMMLPTGLGFFGAFFGATWAGAVPVPLYPPVRPDELEEYVRRQGQILANAEPRVLVADGPFRPVAGLLGSVAEVVSSDALAEAEPAPRWNSLESDLGMLQYTSGSTGAPKGVTLPHDRLLANVRAYGLGVEVRPGDVVVSWLPLYHDMGLIGAVFGSLYHGLPLVLMGPQDFLGRPVRWLRALHRFGGTISAAPNFAYEICARRIPDEDLEGLDLSRWRLALDGSEPVRPDTLERFAARFASRGFRREALFPAYGLAEASVALAFPPVGREARVDSVAREALQGRGRALPARGGQEALRFVSCGTAVKGMEIRIVDPRGRPLEERHQGRVVFRGTSAMAGYYRSPEATAAVRDEEGWIDTGDLGYVAEGELYLTGRSRDMILKGGRNLYPEDVEAAAAEARGVRRGCVAALGLPSREEGTDLLVVVAESHARDREALSRTEAEIRRRVTDALGLPPDRVLVVRPRTLPKTPSGKMRRSACRQRLLDGSLEGRPGRPGSLARLAVPALRRTLQRAGESLYVAWGWAAVAACVAPLVAAGWAGRRAPGWLVRKAARGVLRSLGMRLEVEGRVEPGVPLLVVANHASFLDAVALAAALERDLCFAAAPWVPHDRVFGAVVRSVRHVVVARGDPDRALAEVEALQEALGDGGCLVAFPEGGLEPAPGLRPFALGVFRAACGAGARVQPVALQGTRRALPPETWVPRPGTIRVVLGPLLEPAGTGFEASVDLARRARGFIASECGEPPVERRLGRTD